ncbi:hypothetical protein T484DRAFT_1798139 [Baffinella frigidus]|nr:hypothetical protein T484DRAFT_1798139 [Cryptophyta sp. CCMP2293]
MLLSPATIHRLPQASSDTQNRLLRYAELITRPPGEEEHALGGKGAPGGTDNASSGGEEHALGATDKGAPGGTVPRVAVDLFVNGVLIGRAFDDLPADLPLFPFAALCHSGAQATLTFPPPPNPAFRRRVEEAIANRGEVLEEEVAPQGSTLVFSKGLCVKLVVPPFAGLVVRGVQLTVAESLAPLLLCLPASGLPIPLPTAQMLTVAEVPNVFGREALIVRDARLVSPVVQVSQQFGPAIWGRCSLEVHHCGSPNAELLFVFMPLGKESVGWARGRGTAKVDRAGFYAILSLTPPDQDPDLVRVEYSLSQSSSGDDMSDRSKRSKAIGLHAFGAGAGLAPSFATVKMGSEVHATIRLVAASTAQNRAAGRE